MDCYNCGLPDHPNCQYGDCTATCPWCRAGARPPAQDLGARGARGQLRGGVPFLDNKPVL